MSTSSPTNSSELDKKVDARDDPRNLNPQDNALYDSLRELFAVDSLPHVRKADLQGTGGQLKEHPGFFNVDEVSFEPEEWESEQVTPENASFCLVRIRKSDMDTRAAASRLCDLLRVKPEAISYAGLKDRHACTSQMFSINLNKGLRKDKSEGVLDKETIETLIHQGKDKVPRMFLDGEARLTRRKLRRGDLKGNLFTILVTNFPQDVSLDQAFERALQIKADLETKGIPNYFGEQRLGKSSKSGLEGYRIVRLAEEFLQQAAEKHSQEANASQSEDKDGTLSGKKRTREPSRKEFYAWTRKHKKLRKKYKNFADDFKMHAFQSGIFNLILRLRIEAGLFDKEVLGDVLRMEFGDASRFVDSEDLFTTEEERKSGMSFTCPIVGGGWEPRKEFEVGQIEAKVHELVKFSPAALNVLGLENTRKVGKLSLANMDMKISTVDSCREFISQSHNSDLVDNLDELEDGPALVFSFKLPKGSYATSVLREFIDL